LSWQPGAPCWQLEQQAITSGPWSAPQTSPGPPEAALEPLPLLVVSGGPPHTAVRGTHT
jgi:hypothetical protein